MDCYRLRIDEEYVYSREIRGLYAEGAHGGANAKTVQKNSFIFCWLAVKRKVVPEVRLREAGREGGHHRLCPCDLRTILTIPSNRRW